MRALRLALALVIIIGLAGCGSTRKVMPSVVGLKLDTALSDIERAGVKDTVEVLGGGLFGILDKSNWQVCDQEPAAGAVVTVVPRVTVERTCSGLSSPATTPTAIAPSAGPTEEPTDEPSATSAPTATQPATAAPENQVLTVGNNKEFAALRKLGDNCSSKIGKFADKYSGRIIKFDGSIGAMNQHGSYATRFDILIGFGDDGRTTRGPSFQFRDVNTTSDLHYEGSNIPDAIGRGDNLRITARVDEFNSSQCLLLLEPVSTEFR